MRQAQRIVNNFVFAEAPKIKPGFGLLRQMLSRIANAEPYPLGKHEPADGLGDAPVLVADFSQVGKRFTPFATKFISAIGCDEALIVAANSPGIDEAEFYDVSMVLVTREVPDGDGKNDSLDSRHFALQFTIYLAVLLHQWNNDADVLFSIDGWLHAKRRVPGTGLRAVICSSYSDPLPVDNRYNSVFDLLVRLIAVSGSTRRHGYRLATDYDPKQFEGTVAGDSVLLVATNQPGNWQNYFRAAGLKPFDR